MNKDNERCGDFLTDTMYILDKLYEDGIISDQAYKTYRGQVKHGDETACLIGLKRKKLINHKGEIAYDKKDSNRTSK